MARTERIDQVGVRGRLKARPEPYWRTIRPGQALGYRAGAGTWIARRYHAGDYEYQALGAEVDLSYAQALTAAEEWWTRRASGTPRGYDILAAIEDYARTNTAAPYIWDDLRTINRHVSGELLGRTLDDLKTAELEHWRDALPVKATTRVRVATLLIAALNNAYRLHGVGDSSVWRRMKPIKIPRGTRSRLFIPSEQEIKDLIANCEPDFALLIRAAVLTACRYGELTALEARDFNPAKGTLDVRGKTGERTMMLSSAAVAFFSEQVRGKLPKARMFTTAEGGSWEKSMQHRRMRAATSVRPFVFYSTRHFALSRQLSAGIPSALVAKNSGTSEAMLRAHYHKFIAEDRSLFDRVPAIA